MNQKDDMENPALKEYTVQEVTPDLRRSRQDQLAVEAPMEIRIVHGPADKRQDRSLAITMRTPGRDFELSLGFLFAEGIISSADQVELMERCGPVVVGESTAHSIRLELKPDVHVDMSQLQRHFYTTSSCGVCGKGSIEALQHRGLRPITTIAAVSRDTVFQLPEKLRAAQDIFAQTGGLHGAGLFDDAGNLITLHEDVGRHNAVDKLIGDRLRKGRLPAGREVLMVSGRASFELVQKAVAAEIPIMVAVGAPSSLAVDLATRFGMTLVGFASNDRFNIYSRIDRITD